jgi:hypothetical protein
MSGIKIKEAYVASVTAVSPTVYVLHGVRIDPCLCFLLKDYAKVTVWLDNDSAHVKKQAQTIVDTVLLYNSDVDAKVISDLSDPKLQPYSKIVGTLNG